MIGRTVRGALVAVALVAIPVAPARACHLFDRCCGRPTTTYYAPVAVAAPAPVCCAQPTVVNYMPQTCYRTVYVNTPVVAYAPTTACGPCGATTVMRPVTTYVARPQLVPYTTYRPVVSQMPVAQPCCGSAVPATTMYAPAVSVAPAPACCSPASSATYTPAPSLSPTYSPGPLTSAVPVGTPSSTLQNVTPTPSLDATPSSQPNPTFESSPSDVDQPQSRVLLPPRSSSNVSKRPLGLDPEDQDRTTAIPLRRTVHQASLITPVKADVAPADDAGWRAPRQ